MRTRLMRRREEPDVRREARLGAERALAEQREPELRAPQVRGDLIDQARQRRRRRRRGRRVVEIVVAVVVAVRQLKTSRETREARALVDVSRRGQPPVHGSRLDHPHAARLRAVGFELRGVLGLGKRGDETRMRW